MGLADGAGLLVLKRLSDAERDGDRILALIKGSAVNQDGRSQGITAPNGPSQERVIQRALAVAGLQPHDIDAVEAHGTGTALGDPIEAGALANVFRHSASRRGDRLWLGSSKSNFGHAQGASGVLGVIKMVLALKHEMLPKTLHCETPSSHIDWDHSGLALLQEAQAWPRQEGSVRRAGVSSFGISGTNAHLILEEAPAVTEPAEARAIAPLLPKTLPVLLSGKTPEALQANAHRLAQHIQEHSDVSPLDLAYSLATTRTAFPIRKNLLVEVEDARAGYSQLRQALHNLTRPPEPRVGGLAVLFTGQGTQRPGMGLELLERPGLEVFTRVYEELLATADRHLPRPLREIIQSGESLDETHFTQPALFCLEVALFRQWQAWGLQPQLLLGHSIGELVAAHLAGVFGVDDALRLVCARGRLMQELAIPGGAMLSARLSEKEALELLAEMSADWFGKIELAAVNSPSQVVLSGDTEAVDELFELAQKKGLHSRRLPVSHAFHSRHMEPMLEAFLEVASSLSYTLPTIPIISNLDGKPVKALDADYWVSQVRRPVRFFDGLEKARQLGVTSFLECGPGAALSLLIEDGIPSLSSEGEWDALMSAAGRLCEQRQPLDWKAFFQPFQPRRIDLPTYAFQRRRYWPIPETQPAFLKWALVPGALPSQHQDAATTWQTVPTFTVTQSPHLVLDLRGHGLAPNQLTGCLLHHLQECLRHQKLRALTVITSGALPDPPVTEELDPAAAAAWGLCRALRHERPDLSLHLIDTDQASEAMLNLRFPTGETVLRQGKPWQPRLEPYHPTSDGLPSLRQCVAEQQGTVLITGATGGLGQALALHLVREHGVKHLLLLSRSGQQGAPDLPARLKEAGAVTVTMLACDVGVRDQVAAALEAIPSQHPLVAVFHLAAVLRDSIFSNQSQTDLEAVFSPKWDGACHLDSLTRDCPSLTHFVLFSSVTGLLGNTGQANYAAANAALDALAWQRHRSGLPALSLAWSGWAETGMAARMVSGQPDIPLMSIAQGLHALDVALRQPEPNLAILASQPNLELHHSPLLPGSSGTDRTVIQELLGWPDHEQLARLCDLVCQLAARVLGLSSSANVPEDQPLQELGLDSLMSVELKNRLAALTGEKLPVTFVLDYPDPQGIAQALLERLRARENPELSLEVLQRKLAEIPLAELQQSGLAEAILSYRASTIPVPSQSEASESLPPSSEGLGEGDVVRILKGLLESRGDD
jgi:malonyl CoA-acyl carrier protein transacylase